MRIKAIAATLSKDLLGEQFTESELEKLAEPCTNPIILYDFDSNAPIGRFDKVEVVNHQLVVEAELIGKEFQDKELVKAHRLVPGYIIPGFKITCYGLTLKPADKTLPEIEILS